MAGKGGGRSGLDHQCGEKRGLRKRIQLNEKKGKRPAELEKNPKKKKKKPTPRMKPSGSFFMQRKREGRGPPTPSERGERREGGALSY